MDGGRHEAYAVAVNTYGEAGWCTKREEAREARQILKRGWWLLAYGERASAQRRREGEKRLAAGDCIRCE